MLFKKSLRIYIGGGGLLILLILGGLIFRAERALSRLVLGGLGEAFTTRLYSAPYAIDSQTRAASERLLERLRRLKYSSLAAEPSQAGEYRWEPPWLSVYLRGF